jgi:hypothetical protein
MDNGRTAGRFLRLDCVAASETLKRALELRLLTEPAEGITAFTQQTSLVQNLPSTGFLHGRAQGRRAPRARPNLTGVNGDGHLLVLDQQSQICRHVGAPF